MSEAHFEAETVTAFQPPPPSPTHSVNPDHLAFGTTTLHAERRTTDPPHGRRLDWRDRALFRYLRAGDIYRRSSQPCGKCRDGYQRVCSRNGNQYSLHHHHLLSHSSLTTCGTSEPTQHPGFHNPANAACAYYHNGSDTPASHPVPVSYTHLTLPTKA